MGHILLILFYFLFPVLVIYLDKRSKLVNRSGPVVICYGMGLLVGNIGLLPDRILNFQNTFGFICIFIAIPLVLFSLDIRKWIKLADKTFLSLILGLASVIITAFIGYYLWRDVISDIWQVAGVLVGYYSGGQPNAAAISVALGMENERFLLTQTYDIGVGAVTLLFIMTVAQRFFLLFMRPYTPDDHEEVQDPMENFHEKYESYDKILKKRILLPLLAATGLSIVFFGISAGLSQLLLKRSSMIIIVLGITTLGIVASFVPGIKNIDKSFQGGLYLILVFCLVIASTSDISMFVRLESLPILYYVILVVPGALLLHGILSWMFRIDVDNFLIISVALSMSPPFVPVVASSLKNRNIILPGMIIGLVGYAIGNYLGIAIGSLIHLMI
jgi:uncharacterized membrane protein